MAIEEFWMNLRAAARAFALTAVSSDVPAVGTDQREHALATATAWRTPQSVAGFDAREFDFLESDRKAALQARVDRFRAAVSQAPSSPDQKREAAEAFSELVRLLRPLEFPNAESFRIGTLLMREVGGVLPEWVESVSCETGDDASGDPAVWVWINVTEDAVEKKLIAKGWQPIYETVDAAARAIAASRWPYVRFQSLAELAEIATDRR
jgi:hypothetical protein